MGKRLPKRELRDEIRSERRALDEVLQQLKPAQMTRAGVTPGGWSVKDILAHLVAWQQMNLHWYEAGLRGETPAMPAPGFTLRETPRLNAMLYRKHHHRPLQAVLDDYQTYHQSMLALIEKIPDADFLQIARFNWTGPSWTLSDYIRASTASHYRWARKHIRRWLRAQVKAGPGRTQGNGGGPSRVLSIPAPFETVRQIALALDNVEEGTSYGTPAFRVGGALFARLHQDLDSLVVRMDFEQRAELMAADPATYYITDHYLNYQWVLVRLARVHPDALRDLIRMAWRSAASSKRRATRQRRAAH